MKTTVMLLLRNGKVKVKYKDDLKKAHIGEIQASIWPEDMREECTRLGMQLI